MIYVFIYVYLCIYYFIYLFYFMYHFFFLFHFFFLKLIYLSTDGLNNDKSMLEIIFRRKNLVAHWQGSMLRHVAMAVHLYKTKLTNIWHSYKTPY